MIKTEEEFISTSLVFSNALGRSKRCLRPTCAYKSYVLLKSELKGTRKLPFNLLLFIFSSFAISSACTILQSAFFAFVAAKSTALRSALTHGLYLALSLKWSQHGGADWNTRASVFFHENNRLLDPVFFLRSVITDRSSPIFFEGRGGLYTG